MPLTLGIGTRALVRGAKTTAGAAGGTAPYVYSASAGTINSSTGAYTAPQTTGTVTITVTDATLATAVVNIYVGTVLEIFCDIIRSEMGLTANQVYLWDQKINIPTDSRLYIAVGVQSLKPFGSSRSFQSDGTAVSSANFQATLSLDILSRGADARDRKEQVILALISQYAQSQCEINSFHIGRISTAFLNISEIDGAAIPYRFNISVNVQYMLKSQKAVSYIDSFDSPTVVTES